MSAGDTFLDTAISGAVSSLTTSVGNTFTSLSTHLTDIKGAGWSSGDNLHDMSHVQIRLLGLLHENSVLDQLHFTSDNKLDSGRLRIYDSSVNAIAARTAANMNPSQEYDTGKMAELILVGDYVGANLKVYTMTRSWIAP